MSALDTTVGPIEDTLAFPFREEGWQGKLLIGTLIQFSASTIPFLPGIALAGYAAQIMRRIIVEDGKPHLPDWDDWSTLLGDGLRLFGVTVIYVAPSMLLALAGMGLMMAGGIGSDILAEYTAETAAPLPPLAMMLGWFGAMIGFALAWVLGLVTGLFLPPAQGHVIATGKFSAAFRVREWWPVFRANLSGYILCSLVLLGFWAAYTLVMQILYITVCLCCLTPFLMAPAMFYMSVLAHTLFARAYRVGADKLAAAQS